MARTTHTEQEKAADRVRVANAKLDRLRKRWDQAVADVERLQVEIEQQDALVAHYKAHPALAQQATLDDES